MMEMQTARRIVRDLAAQDGESDERSTAAGWAPSADNEGEVKWLRSAEAIVRGWRDSSGAHGDTRVVEAIDALGEEEAATEYVAAVERLVSERA